MDESIEKKKRGRPSKVESLTRDLDPNKVLNELTKDDDLLINDLKRPTLFSGKTTKEYSVAMKNKAFELYVTYRKLSAVSRETGVNLATLRSWKSKYKWDEVIQKRSFEVGLNVTSRELETRNNLEDLLSGVEYDAAISGSLLPSAVKDYYPAPIVTESELANLSAFTYFEKKYATLMKLQRKVENALDSIEVKPSSWKDIVSTLKFIYDEQTRIRQELKEFQKPKRDSMDVYDMAEDYEKSQGRYFVAEIEDLNSNQVGEILEKEIDDHNEEEV